MATNDIETDAIPIQGTEPMSTADSTSTQTKFNSTQINSCPESDEASSSGRYDEYKHLMNSHLRKDNFEILIISHEDDDRSAREFKSRLMKKVKYSKGHETVSPKVELHRDLIYEDDSPSPELDFSLKKTVFVFLLATSSFCEDHWTIFEGRVSLDSVFKKGCQKNFLYVVHTKPKKSIDYKLPSTIESAKHLYFSENDSENDLFYSNVKSMLESKVYILIDKDYELDEERRNFLLKRDPKKFAMFTQSDGHSFHSQAGVVIGVQESKHGQTNGQLSEIPPSSSEECPGRGANDPTSEVSADVEVDSTLVKEVDRDVEVDSGGSTAPTPRAQVALDIPACDRGVPEGGEMEETTGAKQAAPPAAADPSTSPTSGEQNGQGEDRDIEVDTAYNSNFANMNLSTTSAPGNDKASTKVEPASDSGFDSTGSINNSS